MTFYSRITANKFKTFFLMLFFPTMIVGMVLLGSYALEIDEASSISLAVMSLLFSVVYAFSMYMWGDQIVLKMNDAQPLTEETHKKIFRMVENLCIASGLPMPKVYVIPDSSLNAFATGRSPKHASIALTQGIIEKLEDAELEGVIAHELSHVKNYDTLVLALTIVMVNSIQLLGDWMLRMSFHSGNRQSSNNNSGGSTLVIALVAILLYIVGGFIAILVQQAISRKREYMADANAALMTRYPQALASALRKISYDPRIEHIEGKASFASFYIANPLKSTFWNKLLSSHPPIEKRIAILEGMGDVSSLA